MAERRRSIHTGHRQRVKDDSPPGDWRAGRTTGSWNCCCTTPSPGGCERAGPRAGGEVRLAGRGAGRRGGGAVPGARSGAAHRCPAQADPGGRGALPPEPGGPGGAGAPDGRRLRTAGALLLRGQERDDLPACAGWEEQASGGCGRWRRAASAPPTSICAGSWRRQPPSGRPRSIWPTTTSATWPSLPGGHLHNSDYADGPGGVGIELLDHLVFVDGDMVSMRDSGMMK